MKNRYGLLVLLCIITIVLFSSTAMATDVSNYNNTAVSIDDGSLSISSINQEPVSIESTGDTYIVDGSGDNQMSNPTIQNTIDKAKDGDTIIITGDKYSHCHFIVDKQLTIKTEKNTVMTPCPSNTKGSGGYGIFYISEKGSGTIIDGFTLESVKAGDYDSSELYYSIYSDGANDITIKNCMINTQYGPGIWVNNCKNLTIDNNTIKKSVKGIYVTNSENIVIQNNDIENNYQAGIYFGENVVKSNVLNNIIKSNNKTGIFYGSCIYANVKYNVISDNREKENYQEANEGEGIYVNSSITKMEIKGNYIAFNGEYGIFNNYPSASSITDQYVEIIDQNYFVGGHYRTIFTQRIKSTEHETGIVFIWSNIIRLFTLCPSTFYAPEVYALDGSRNLKMVIDQVQKGVYKISFIRANDSTVATELNSISVNVYLNKANTEEFEPSSSDIYRVVKIVNGTGIADFRNETYKTSKNSIIAGGPGYGYLDDIARATATYKISDSDIPGDSYKIIGKDTTLYYKNGSSFVATLIDDSGNPIGNEDIQFTINNGNYTRTTDNNGKASLKINLAPGKYTIITTYKDKISGEETIILNTVTVLSTIESSDLTKYYRGEEQYAAKFLDGQGNPLKNTKVTFNIDGVMYTRTTDQSGMAWLSINLRPNTFIITAINPVNGQMQSNKITILSTLESKDLVKYYKNGSQYQVKVLDRQGKPIANKAISMNIDGVFYTRTTDENGTATLAINLRPGTFIITAIHPDNGEMESNKITILSTVEANDLVKDFQNASQYHVKILDDQGKPIVNKTVSMNIDGVFYTRTTDENGTATLAINLRPGTFIITVEHPVNHQMFSNKITVNNVLLVKAGTSNNDIQKLLDSVETKRTVCFTGNIFNDISLNISKPVTITGEKNNQINGKMNSAVFTINCDDVEIKNLNILSKEYTSICVNNSKNVNILNNNISNSLNKNKIEEYMNGSISLQGNGVEILNSSEVLIEYNKIDLNHNGIYLENSQNNDIKNNIITKNNYGTQFGPKVANTLIKNNNISNEIGLITFEYVEGPLGYGIYIKDSGVNISIIDNYIYNNYLGIYFDAPNSTGIIVSGNLISESVCEGFSFNKHYTPLTNDTEVIIEDNAIYNNAKGPSVFILGEISANPEGIYGPGEWDDSKKLVIGPNWYGTNIYTKWGNITGPGTLCPRIKTTLITFNISSDKAGSYNITFYKNGTKDNKLCDFDIYYYLNYNTNKEEEIKVTIHNGTGILKFNPENYFESNNTIKASCGPLHSKERIYNVMYEYHVPNEEIPKIS